MTKRASRIQEVVLKMIWENGGHHTVLNMKSGHTLHIVRKGHSSFENLELDSFDMLYNGRKRVMKNAELGSIANYIDETYR